MENPRSAEGPILLLGEDNHHLLVMASGSRSPPSSPRRDVEENEEGTAIDDWMLASIESWVRSSGRPQDDVVERIMTSFDMEELRQAATRLRDGKATVKFTVPDRGTADYSRRLATEVYKAILSVQDQSSPSVQFWVCAGELHKVPGAAFVDKPDEVGVTARLGGVDAKLNDMMERLKEAEGLKETVKDLARIVTSLQEQLKAQQLQPPQVQNGASYADKTRSRAVQRLQGLPRERSGSVKRGRQEDIAGGSQVQMAKQLRMQDLGEIENARSVREAHPATAGSALSQDLQGFRNSDGEDGWQVPRKKKQGSIRKGNSAVQAEGGIAAPVSVFISGTSPNCTEEIVKEKLLECATAMSSGQGQENAKELVVLRVEHIPIKIPQGEERRSRCWKVTVSPECSEHMAKDEAYPAAWGWRKWNRGPRASEQGPKSLELRTSQVPLYQGSRTLGSGASQGLSQASNVGA